MEVSYSIAHCTICFTKLDVPELQSSIQFEPVFTAVLILHPATYLNKVLVASSQGSMELWNIRTQSVPLCILYVPVLIVLPGHVFTSIPPQTS